MNFIIEQIYNKHVIKQAPLQLQKRYKSFHHVIYYDSASPLKMISSDFIHDAKIKMSTVSSSDETSLSITLENGNVVFTSKRGTETVLSMELFMVLTPKTKNTELKIMNGTNMITNQSSSSIFSFTIFLTVPSNNSTSIKILLSSFNDLEATDSNAEIFNLKFVEVINAC